MSLKVIHFIRLLRILASVQLEMLLELLQLVFCDTVALHSLFHTATNTHRNVRQLIFNINEF